MNLANRPTILSDLVVVLAEPIVCNLDVKQAAVLRAMRWTACLLTSPSQMRASYE